MARTRKSLAKAALRHVESAMWCADELGEYTIRIQLLGLQDRLLGIIEREWGL